MAANEIKILKDLVYKCCDAEEFYDEASETTEDNGMRELYNRMKDVHVPIIADLNQRINSLGGDTDEDTTIIGDISSSYGMLKAALSSHTDESLVNSLEEVEEELLQDFYAQYQDETLSDETRLMLKPHIKALKQAYAKMKEANEVMSATAA